MDKLDVLERHYNSFINLDDPKGFFDGFADYLELIDGVPEFEQITLAIQAEKNALEENLGVLEKRAFDKITEIYGKLMAYVSKHKINSNSIIEVSKNYDDWLNGRTAGSSSIPDALHDYIREIVKQLFHIPEHKEFASQYIRFENQYGTEVKVYVPLQEYNEFREAFDNIKRKTDTTLWGHLNEMSWLYDIVKRGREKNKALVEKYRKNRLAKTAYEIMNYQILLAEWVAIENDEERKLKFFDIKKVRQWVTRLHNRILKDVVIGQNKIQSQVITTTEGKSLPISFQPKLIIEKGIGHLQLFKQTKKHKIGGTQSRHFRLLKCLFSPENNLEASFNPTFQKYDRVFDAILLPKDDKNSRLKNPATMKTAKTDIIKFTVKQIQKIKSLQGYLRFEWSGDNLRMNISPPEGKSLTT